MLVERMDGADASVLGADASTCNQDSTAQHQVTLS